jgi:outer membrane protein OmpA-like peptidoglycan-associated protein
MRYKVFFTFAVVRIKPNIMKHPINYLKNLACLIAFFCFFLSALSSNAQEMLGAANSNYSGTSSLMLNPSTFVDNRLNFELTLLAGGFTMDNDYVYYPKGKIGLFDFGAMFDSDNRKFSDVKNYNNHDARNGGFASFARPLSALFQIKDHWFSVSPYALRTAGTFDNVQFALAKFAYEEEGIHYSALHGNTYDVPAMNIGGMLWSEVSLTYGHALINKRSDYLKGALTIKRLFGHMAGYARVDEGSKFQVTYDPQDVTPKDTVNPAVIEFTNVNMEYGHAFNDDFSGWYSPYDSKGILGTGWGFDVGFTYEYRPDYSKYTYRMDGQDIDDPTQNHYKLRAGLSVVDIGKINFDTHAQSFNLKSDYAKWTNWDKAQFDSELDFDTTMSKIFYDSLPDASKGPKSFDMGLPRAISLQLDYQLIKDLFVNATWIQRWKRNTPEVVASNLLSVTPRFEHKWFDVAIPMSMYQYDRFRIGIAFRIAGLTIGSDKLGGMLGLTDLGGLDYYASLSFLLDRHKIKDRDADGVSDKLDKCPDTPGPWATMGCPDRDGDGIIDSEDACPDVFGLKQFNGCPDKDDDGIPDKDDLCPDVPGLAQFNGCPDTDGDGIPDPQDSCITVPGLPEFHGCPDTDGDGIPDPQDSCITEKGPIEFHGCPDTDGDGLIDKLDSCPLVKGPISNKGCPVVEKKAEPVKVELTKEEEEVINKVFKNLEFETAKATIRESSFPSLDELAKLLVKKQNFKLLIDGHTDNVGGAAYNMKLSQNRANSVKTYLVNKGIDASRITAKGYGMTKPIASNKTKEGRQKNRRVEFTIVE